MKRSSQVALLLMGAAGVGAGGYALTSPRDCVAPNTPAAIAPATPGVAPGRAAPQPCPSGRSSSWGTRYYGGHWSRPIFSRTSTTPAGSVPLTGRSSTPSVPRSTTTSSQRGGFGSTGHAMSSSS